MQKDRIKRLDPQAFSRFWPLCPDFVAELRRPTDRIHLLAKKMEEWLSNGAQLGWLIDPETRIGARRGPCRRIRA